MPNGSIEFKLGELEQFKTDVLSRFDKIEEKIDGLSAWRWKATGMAAGVGGVVGFIADKIFK